MGINVRQSIAVIAEILPYNNYLGNYLLHKKSLSFNKNEEILKYLTVTSSKLDQGYFNNADYLQLLNSIVTVIRKLVSICMYIEVIIRIWSCFRKKQTSFLDY